MRETRGGERVRECIYINICVCVMGGGEEKGHRLARELASE